MYASQPGIVATVRARPASRAAAARRAGSSRSRWPLAPRSPPTPRRSGALRGCVRRSSAGTARRAAAALLAGLARDGRDNAGLGGVHLAAPRRRLVILSATCAEPPWVQAERFLHTSVRVRPRCCRDLLPPGAVNRAGHAQPRLDDRLRRTSPPAAGGRPGLARRPARAAGRLDDPRGDRRGGPVRVRLGGRTRRIARPTTYLAGARASSTRRSRRSATRTRSRRCSTTTSGDPCAPRAWCAPAGWSRGSVGPPSRACAGITSESAHAVPGARRRRAVRSARGGAYHDAGGRGRSRAPRSRSGGRVPEVGAG